MSAIVYFIDGSKSLVKVNLSYSCNGVHYYKLTLNALNTFLDFKPGETKLYKDTDIVSLVYTMS